jgi:hypothetical protein
MALKREPEIKWNWKQPPAPFPQTPGANGCFLSPSGGGKSSTLISMLLGPYRGIFSEIHVFSPSVFIDSAFDSLVKYAKTLDTDEYKSSFHDTFDEPAMLAIIAKQREKIKELKLTKTKKPLPQAIILLDDVADSGVMHTTISALTSCYIRGRHLGLSTWLSTQKLSTISPVCRSNFAFILIWELRNRKELYDGVLHELSNIHSLDTLFEMYKMSTEEPHSFMYVNLRVSPPEFYIRFEEKLVIE